MKNGKRPTLKQLKRIRQLKYRGRKLDPNNWLVVKGTSTDFVIVNRKTGHQESFLK